MKTVKVAEYRRMLTSIQNGLDSLSVAITLKEICDAKYALVDRFRAMRGVVCLRSNAADRRWLESMMARASEMA